MSSAHFGICPLIVIGMPDCFLEQDNSDSIPGRHRDNHQPAFRCKIKSDEKPYYVSVRDLAKT
ncbi:hypothetical protein J1614_010080 [Plenodomus biglobosus]|nr:hypothetical protein J1614_010080 [Plenodomus biglobosus]